MATGTLISVEECLRTSYSPDVEYIDGELKEKPGGGFPHGKMQAVLGHWFVTRCKQWGIQAAVNTRTRVEPRRVRLPDVVVVDKSERSKAALEAAPLIAIEVLSPDDTFADLEARAADLHAMGCANVWLIDPDTRTARVWTNRTWVPVDGEAIHAAGSSPIHLDLAWLWAEMADLD